MWYAVTQHSMSTLLGVDNLYREFRLLTRTTLWSLKHCEMLYKLGQVIFADCVSSVSDHSVVCITSHCAVYNTPYIYLTVKRYVGWSCVLNCFMLYIYHPYLVSMLFSDLLSLHLVTFLMFLILVYIAINWFKFNWEMNWVGTDELLHVFSN